ncbi:Pyrimidine-specific ribonucleoside hydrolase RihA [Thalassocella blandensis]|nr:Pyrimidine-specific ribonucleoside hydrolase RihA [Thalassocella blandensis]
MKLTILTLILFLSGNLYAKTPVIFDTDMAIDDWSALLLLAKHPKIDLLAVTANGVGETRCEPAMKNIPALLDLTPASNEVAFACGDDYPMEGYYAFPEPWRKQADTLSGVSLPESKRKMDTQHAVDLIHQKIKDAKSKVTLIATGSLTNIAQWLTKYPKERDSIARLVIMGGAFDVPGNIIVPGFTDNHPNQHAEWNMFVDAKAAAQVFASGLPIEVVGLDVTNQVKVTKAFAKEFKSKASTPAAEFWDKVLDDNDWFIDSGEYFFWDVLAALVVIDRSFCKGEMASVTVTHDKAEKPWEPSSLKSIPETTTEGKKRQHLSAKTAGVTRIGGNNPKVKICRKTQADKAFKVFTDTLNRKNSVKK